MDTIYIDERASGPGGYPIAALVLGFGLVLGGLVLLHSVLSTFALIFSHDWTYLTTPDAPGYDPFWKLVVGAELLMSLLLTALLSAVLISFGLKRKSFVRLTMLWMMAWVLVSIVDHNLSAIIPALYDDGTVHRTAYRVLIAGVVAVIWMPYLMFSRRLKQAFVN
jgi:hypothetical protein